MTIRQSYLEEHVIYSLRYRDPVNEGRRGKGGKEKLWANSKEPLKQPLIRNLQGNSELCHLASDSFTDILSTGSLN